MEEQLMSPRANAAQKGRRKAEKDCLGMINGQFAPYPAYNTWQDCFPEVLDSSITADLADYDSDVDGDFVCVGQDGGMSDGEGEHFSDMEDVSEDEEAFVAGFWASLA